MQVQNESIVSFTPALKNIFEFYKTRSRLAPEQLASRISELNSNYSVNIPDVNLFLVEHEFVRLFGNPQNHSLNILFSTIQYWPITRDFPAEKDLLELINNFFKRYQVPPNNPPPSTSPKIAGITLFFEGRQPSGSKKRKLTTIDNNKFVEAIRRVYYFYVKHQNDLKPSTTNDIFQITKLSALTDAKDALAESTFVSFIKQLLKKNGFIKFDINNAISVEVTDKPFFNDTQLEEILTSFKNEKKEYRREGHKRRAARQLKQPTTQEPESKLSI